MSDVVEVLYRDTVVVESGDNKVIVIEPKVIINQSTSGDSQIQSDWNQADNTKKDFIKNKPTIPDELKDLADDAAHRTVTDTDKEYWNNKAEANDYALISDVSGMISDAKNPTVLPEETDIDTVVDNGKYSIGSVVVSVTSLENGTVYQEVLLDEYISQFRSGNNGEWSDWVVYASATSIDNLYRAIVDSIGDLTDTVNNKVDKVPGKGLSTNDYTDADKAKLAAAVTSSTIATIVTLTQTAYDALNPKVATTLYIITGV